MIALPLLTALNCRAAAQAWTHQSAPAKGLTRIEASASAGPITVTAKKDAKTVEVDVVGKDPDGICDLVFQPSGETLTVGTETKGLLRLHACPLGFKITAPADLDLKLTDGAGKIDVKGFAGETDIKDGAGDIGLRDVRGRLSVDTGAGVIEGRLGPGNATVRTGAGSVMLAWPDGGAHAVDVTAGTGSVTLELPKGTRVDADITAGIGSVRNPFPEEKGAATSITVRAGVGSVTLVEK